MFLSNTLSCYITQHFFLFISLAKGKNTSSQEVNHPIEQAMKLLHPTTSGAIPISIWRPIKHQHMLWLLKEAAFPLCNRSTATHEACALVSQRCRTPCPNPVPPLSHLRKHRYEVYWFTTTHWQTESRSINSQQSWEWFIWGLWVSFGFLWVGLAWNLLESV